MLNKFLTTFFHIFSYPVKSHPLSDDFANLVEKLPSVVNVFTVQNQNHLIIKFLDNIPQFRDFLKFSTWLSFWTATTTITSRRRKTSALAPDLLFPLRFIVTNNHVIEQANEIKVKFQDETELEAKLIGKDKLTDLALLKVESKKS